MDGEAWWAIVHGVAKSWTRLRDFTYLSTFHNIWLSVFHDEYIMIAEIATCENKNNKMLLDILLIVNDKHT